MTPTPTPAKLIEKIRRALDSFSRYMGDTGCACDTTRDDYLNADVALHTLEALFTASHGGAEKVFCAFLNNMTVDANALPIVTLDKPKIMAAIQAAMLARATTQETNLVPEKTPSSTDNTPRDRATRDKISQVVLKWYGQTIQAAIGELLALHDTSPPTDGLRSAREYAEAFSTEWGAYFTIKDLQDAAHAKWVDIFEQWAKRIQQNAITSQSEKLRVMREAPDESGWVVELEASSPAEPQYWAGSGLFSCNNLTAIRFARKQDAERAAMMMLDGMNIRICEHIWAAAIALADKE